MDMLPYLTALIKTRKEVGIPGLGTIYKKKSPGRYDAETHSFLPPSYVLSFSPELIEDQSLVAHICKERNISPDAAGYFVNQFAEGIHKQLEDHQEADFHPLGTLSNISGTLVFKPSDHQNFGFDFYGLPVLKDTVPEISNNSEALNADELESIVEENEVEEENPGDGTEEHPIIAGEDPSTAITEQEEIHLIPQNQDIQQEKNIQPEAYVTANAATPEQPIAPQETDDQPTFEEIEELKTPEKPIQHPVIETPEGMETTEEPVTTRPTINEIYAQAAHQAAVPEPIKSQANTPEITEEQPVFYNSNTEDATKGKTPVYLKILIVLLLIMIGVAAAYFIRPDLFDSIIKRVTAASAVPIDPLNGQNNKQVTDSLAYEESLKRNTTPAKDSTQKDTTSASKEAGKVTAAKPATASPAATPPTTDIKPVATTPAAAQTGITFEVIGSSVSGQKEVDHFIAQMKRVGITAKAISPAPGKKKIKISIATFKDEAAARAELPKLEEKLGIKGLYVHTNKPL